MIVARSLEAGASGYVLKDTSSEELVKAVQQVSAGQAFLSSELAVKVAFTRTNVPANPLADLTPRELQVLALLAEGKPYETISDELAVSYKTVVNTSSQLKHKLKVRSLPQLIRIAVRLLAPPT
jgi:two-component system, NarL family, invasion response regulator UvrY